MTSRNVLYLVRHGESAGNVNLELGRSDDPPLTERGRAQAARAAAALAELRIEGGRLVATSARISSRAWTSRFARLSRCRARTMEAPAGWLEVGTPAGAPWF